MRKKLTSINEEARAALDITRDEYALCQYALYRAADPRMKKAGWCSDTKQEVADFVGITPRGLYKMLHKLSDASLLEIDPATGFLRATAIFIDAENQKRSGTKFTPTMNKVHTDYEQSSHSDMNKVHTQYRGIVRVKSKSEGEQETADAAPAPENQHSTLEAFSFSNNEQAAGAGPRPSDKPTAVEFHTDLVKQIGQFYKAYPAQWTDSVKQGPGSRYSNDELLSMLDDYCSHTFANRNTFATFSQHHGNFIRWIKNQKQFERRQPADVNRPANPNAGLKVYQ